MNKQDELDWKGTFQGGIDLHNHPSPSIVARDWNMIEVAREYIDAGFVGAVAKSHHHATYTDVMLANQCGLDDLPFTYWGSISLNNAVGGLNPWAVDTAIRGGARIVWLPTVSARQHLEYYARTSGQHPAKQNGYEEQPVDLLDERGHLLPALHTIIEIVRDAGDVILASGHISGSETVAVFEHAAALGLKRLVVTHPPLINEMTLEEAHRLAECGAYFEHILMSYDEMSPVATRSFDILVTWLEEFGGGVSILSSDFGLKGSGSPVAAYRRICERLIERGVEQRDLHQMIVTNPRQVLGLEPSERHAEERRAH